MQLGMVYCGLQASWSAYCLTMAAIGAPEVITEVDFCIMCCYQGLGMKFQFANNNGTLFTQLKKMKDIDERVGEITFHMFWYYWPTNFGMILQSLLYGPGGVANSLDTFEFL